MKELFKLNLHLFDANGTNVTTDSGMTAEIKTYYSKYLIKLVEGALVHNQFGQKHPIPDGNGKTIEFRKWNKLPKVTGTLTEGVTPDGQDLSVSTITATVGQYGGYVKVSDILETTAIDNVVLEATDLIASQANRSLDTVIREELAGGTNVLYAVANNVRATSRAALTKDHKITVDDFKRGVTILKNQDAPKINGDYVAIVHPSVAYDIMKDDEWIDAHKYSDPTNLYNGELGKVAGIRFVESTEAKVWNAADLSEASRTLTVASVSGTNVTIKETLTATDIAAIKGRKVYIGANQYEVASATTTVLTMTATASGTADTVIYPGEVDATGVPVYATLLLGANAYGVTELSGQGLKHIVKQLGSAGTADPLDQRATIGWKATLVAKRLVEEYMLRIESSGTFTDVAAN